MRRLRPLLALALIAFAVTSCSGKTTNVISEVEIDVCREVFSAAGAYSEFALNYSQGNENPQSLNEVINRLLFVSKSVSDEWEQEYFRDLASDLKKYQLDIENGGFGLQASSLIMSNFQTKKYLRLCPLGIPAE